MLLGASEAPARGSVTYLGLSHGWGQVVDLAFVVLARLYRSNVVIHHHTFAYLDTPSVLTRIVCRAAGHNAEHIALCPAMKAKLQMRYGRELRVTVVSNAVLLPPVAESQGVIRDQLRTVGFLSNITPEKGIFDFLDVAEALAGTKLRFTIAGPFANRAVEDKVRFRLDRLPNVHYVGPVYGAEKARYLQELDVLLFPTQYKNEAEPLTLYEAMSFAIPSIAIRRGCIEYVLGDQAGRVVDRNESYVQTAVRQLQEWLAEPAVFRRVSESARLRYESLREQDDGLVTQLLDTLFVSQ